MTLLYIKYTSFVSCCCREDFFMYFYYKSMVDYDMPEAPLAAFIQGEYYTLVHTTYERFRRRFFFMFFEL